MRENIPTEEEMRAALIERHGEEIQQRFAAASVAVCGLGGLGSNIAIALARAGVGHLHLIEFDRDDISNLNRQQYEAQTGQYKTEALAGNLRKIAPYIKITTDTVRITAENATELLQGEEIICEAFDSAEAKAMLVNHVLENMSDRYLVSGSGMAGIDSANLIKTRKLMDRFYLCGDGVSDVGDGLGLFSARVLVCAAHQATMILRIIAGMAEA
mgnify:FL=1